MALPHEIEKLLHAPLEDVLLKLYPATFLKWLYDVNLRQLAEACPEALPRPDRSQVSGPDRLPKKAYLITLLLAVLRHQGIGRRFLQSLPEPTREAISIATWEGPVNLAALEQQLGGEVAQVNPNERRIAYEPLLLPPEHGFFAVRRNTRDYWFYDSYGGRKPLNKADFQVLLPDAVRNAFKALVPPPAGYELEPLADRPANADRCYACADSLLADLRLVAEFIAQGHLKYTKSERVAVPSLRTLRTMTSGQEFFDGAADPDLALLRTRLLTGGVAFAGDREREALLAEPGNTQAVRDLCNKALANAPFLHEELLGHLVNRHNRWCEYSVQSVRNLALFFARFPSGQWISWENIRSYHALRESHPTLFGQNPEGLQAHAVPAHNAWSQFTAIHRQNQFELIGEPLLKGFAFLLAALGMAEITYDPRGTQPITSPNRPT